MVCGTSRVRNYDTVFFSTSCARSFQALLTLFGSKRLLRKLARNKLNKLLKLQLTRHSDNQRFTRLASIPGRHRISFIKIIYPQVSFGFFVFSNKVHRLNGCAVCRHGHQCHLQGGVGRDFESLGVPLVWLENDCTPYFVCDA